MPALEMLGTLEGDAGTLAQKRQGELGGSMASSMASSSRASNWNEASLTLHRNRDSTR